MPPLPVSKMKLSVSGKFANLALNMITPPDNCLKRNEVKSLEGPSTNCSCAVAEIDTAIKKQNNICVTGLRITIWHRCDAPFIFLYLIEQKRRSRKSGISDKCPANRRTVALICCICLTSYNNNPTNNYRL